MKYMKILICLNIWHIIPYKVEERKIQDFLITEYGWLCFRAIFTWKGGKSE